MDGVLLDSGDAHAKSWRALAREDGRSVMTRELTQQFGKPSRDIVRALFGSELTDAEVTRRDDRKEALYRDIIRENIPVMPGAVEAVRRLHAAGLALAVGSSGPAANIDLMLDGLEIRPMFGAVVTGFDVKRGKPAPDVFLLAAERAGVPADQCVVIEDAPVGLQAAKAAGMIAVGLTGTHAADVLHDADKIVSSLDELTPEFIRSL